MSLRERNTHRAPLIHERNHATAARADETAAGAQQIAQQDFTVLAGRVRVELEAGEDAAEQRRAADAVEREAVEVAVEYARVRVAHAGGVAEKVQRSGRKSKSEHG